MGQTLLPHFLIIGAMKSGTTTLYHDLLTHPRVFMPEVKEPDNLASDEVLTEPGLAAYRALFRDARPEQLCAEASTAYTKQPWITGVPERALRVLGPNVKLIYIMRDPVSRALSQYRHMLCNAAVPEDIDFAFRRQKNLVEFSRYAMQLEPWIATFGRDALKAVCFERYVADRPAGVSEVLSFLGVDPSAHNVRTDVVYHASDRRPVLCGRWKRVVQHGLYQRLVRRLLSEAARKRWKRRLLPRIDTVIRPPSMETIDLIISRVEDDQRQLTQMLGLDEPMWDLKAIRAHHEKRLRAVEQESKPQMAAC
jgi:hypothetical protein